MEAFSSSCHASEKEEEEDTRCLNLPHVSKSTYAHRGRAAVRKEEPFSWFYRLIVDSEFASMNTLIFV